MYFVAALLFTFVANNINLAAKLPIYPASDDLSSGTGELPDSIDNVPRKGFDNLISQTDENYDEIVESSMDATDKEALKDSVDDINYLDIEKNYSNRHNNIDISDEKNEGRSIDASDEKNDGRDDDASDEVLKENNSEGDIEEQDAEIGKNSEEIDEDKYIPNLHAGFLFDTTYFNLNQMRKYIKSLEEALEHLFKETVEEASHSNGTYTNTTEEDVEINGRKYKLQKSIIKGGDNSSSVFIETIELMPKFNRTKRSNWFAEEAQSASEEEP